MKRLDLLNLWSVLLEASNKSSNTKFNYAILKNKNFLKPEIDAINEVTPKVPQKFEIERIKIIEELCKKDENDVPVIVNNQYTFDEESNIQVTEKLQELQEKHKDALEKYKDSLENFNNLLDEEVVDLKLYKISVELLPENLSMEELQAFELILE